MKALPRTGARSTFSRSSILPQALIATTRIPAMATTDPRRTGTRAPMAMTKAPASARGVERPMGIDEIRGSRCESIQELLIFP